MPPAASQIPGKYLCFLVTRATEKWHVNPENLVLSLTRLRDFLVEREVKDLLLPVYDPNREQRHGTKIDPLSKIWSFKTMTRSELMSKLFLSSSSSLTVLLFAG